MARANPPGRGSRPVIAVPARNQRKASYILKHPITREQARRLEALLEHQENHVTEADRRLIHSPGVVSPHSPNDNTYDVQLELGERGLFRVPAASFADRHYDLSATSRLLNECAAWQFAQELGSTYAQIVQPAVWRKFVIGGKPTDGTFSLNPPGGPFFTDAPVSGPADAAALFDTLVGHRARTSWNAHLDPSTQRLTLINNGHAFANLGDDFEPGYFTKRRYDAGRRALTKQELATVQQLVSGDGLERIKKLLSRDRALALEARVLATLTYKVILRPDWPVPTPDLLDKGTGVQTAVQPYNPRRPADWPAVARPRRPEPPPHTKPPNSPRL